jgi:uncharacterized protein YbjT (DUF2867 family)
MNSPKTLLLTARALETGEVFQSLPDAANEPCYLTGVALPGLLESAKKLRPAPGDAADPYSTLAQRLCARLKAPVRTFCCIVACVGRCA